MLCFSNFNEFIFKLDIQWEYPGAVEYGAAVDSKQRYTSLIKVILFWFKLNFREIRNKNYKFIFF